MIQYLWTSEAVTKGHPDKMSDAIADAILDAHLTEDPNARVACEVTCCHDLVLLTGEITSSAKIDVESVARKTICDIGYVGGETCYDGNTVPVQNHIHSQSPEIANAVIKDDGELGAGDQGIMFGFATNETPNYMPIAHHLAFDLVNNLERFDGALPDGKTQVTILYDNGVPKKVDTVLVSSAHSSRYGATPETFSSWKEMVIANVIAPVAEHHQNIGWSNVKMLVNPAGPWSFCGPAADTGLSGRKIVVDNYGADCPVGGGSASGKCAKKQDRSGAYMARYLAKNIVASGLVSKATVQLAYAIGVKQPVSLRVIVPDCDNPLLCERIEDAISKNVDMSPKGIIERFKLCRPIYRQTASGGHFGREGFPWEELDLVPCFKNV